ncbi:MAG: tetratricopeptide repeat protein [Desulfobacula sp.]|nr:tetratricopeptide repeat protein [Desulfobacula sp.]
MPRIWIIACIFLITGCAVRSGPGVLTTMGSKIKGEYYLQEGKYDRGVAEFRERVVQNPSDASAHYYLGRFYLIQKHTAPAVEQLSRAVSLAPDQADHHFWLGMAYAEAKSPMEERDSYIRALSVDKHHWQALLFLSHNRMKAREYEPALNGYTRLLEKVPDNPQALYNRALILRTLGRTAEANGAWKAYLDHYPSGAFARQAADFLNEGRDFTYQNYRIGKRILTLEQIQFDPEILAVQKESLPVLTLLGRFLAENPKTVLHVVVYEKNEPGLSERKAKAVKKTLLSTHPMLPSGQVRVSWFGTAGQVKVNDRIIPTDHLIHFFTQDTP